MLDSLMAQSPELRSLQSRLARILYRAGIRADRATIIGGISGIAAGVLFAYQDTALGILLLALSGGLDAVDGTIAREFEEATALGGVLDLTLDRVVEVAVLLGLIWPHPALQLPAVIVMATWYVNITAFMATGAALGASEKLIHYPPGLVERSEALLFFALLALAPRSGLYLCYAYAALEAATAIQRVIYALGHLGASSDRQV
jgi:archaetidylinositol phosphate synthase